MPSRKLDASGICWRETKCPFCGKVLVCGYDWHDLPDSIAGSGAEPTFSEDPCEHVAYFRSWGFEDGQTLGPYGNALAGLFGSDDDEEGGEELDFPLEDVAAASRKLRRKLPDHDVRIAVDYFGTGGGPKGGEVAEYLFVLLREKAK